MTAPQSPDAAAGRRAADTMAITFKREDLKAAVLPSSLPEGEVEVIDLGVVLPPGSEDDFQPAHAAAVVNRAPLTPQQRNQQLQLVQLKRSIEAFKTAPSMSRIDMADIKRGDVVAIKTIVGTIYLRIVDRIKGAGKAAGEALCEVHYELGDLSPLAHPATIRFPVCAGRHVIVNADGSQRQASRKLNMSTEAGLPSHVTQLLHEQFFVELSVFVNPQPERFRLIDFGRFVARIFRWIMAVIEENNRIEREKREKKAEAKRQKQEEKQRQKEEKLAARKAGKNPAATPE